MSTLAFVFGALLLALGMIALPSPPASPEEVKSSEALTGFFFGGWLVICGIFIRKYGRHGKIGVGIVSLCGLCLALYRLIPPISNGEPLPAPLLNGPLLIISLTLSAVTMVAWRQSQGVRVNPKETAD
ncbi:MAG: hypothetical protein ACON5H_12720 [Akkermansiaceae bacterium]